MAFHLIRTQILVSFLVFFEFEKSLEGEVPSLANVHSVGTSYTLWYGS